MNIHFSSEQAMDVRDLISQNPWWVHRERIRDDPRIADFERVALYLLHCG